MSNNSDLLARVENCAQDLKDLASLDDISRENQQKLGAILQDGIRFYASIKFADDKGTEVPLKVLTGVDEWCNFVDSVIANLAAKMPH